MIELFQFTFQCLDLSMLAFQIFVETIPFGNELNKYMIRDMNENPPFQYHRPLSVTILLPAVPIDGIDFPLDGLVQ
jgi:hypothetical protein